MTIIAAVPALVALGGLLLLAFAGPKLAELGRAMLWCGLLVFLFSVSGRVVQL